MLKIPETTARQIMVTDVLELQVDAPVRDAVEAFEDYHIHGAPVVDAARRLVGVLSDADIVRIGRVREGRVTSVASAAEPSPEREGDDEVPDPEFSEFAPEEYSPELLGRETVGDWMTTEVITVAPEATLQEICSILDREQIHRVFVVDGEKLAGVVSTMDVVRCIARAGRG
jgi:CBS domain-containing protein